MSLPLFVLIAGGCFLIGFLFGRLTAPKLAKKTIFADRPVLTATERWEINNLLERGEVIAAIKQYREITGASLKTAKEAIDQMRADQS